MTTLSPTRSLSDLLYQIYTCTCHKPALRSSLLVSQSSRSRTTTTTIASHLRSSPSTAQSRTGFHTSTPCAYARNRERGASAIHRRPHPGKLSLLFKNKNIELPEPRKILDIRKRIQIDDNHPLWGFFNKDKASLPTPEDDHKHGRAWTVEELRHKSWLDIHRLWWVCAKERNIIATQQNERQRLNPGYGESEAQKRERAVLDTQRAIKHTLTERHYAWQEALKIAEKDETVNLSGKGRAYIPSDLMEGEKDEESAFEETEDETVPKDTEQHEQGAPPVAPPPDEVVRQRL